MAAPEAPTSAAAIPLVDLALPQDEVSEQIRVALRDFGFMYLKNSGQMEAIAELRAAALEFFAQPEDAKVAAAAGQPGAVRGYYSERSLNTYKATGREGPPDYCSQFFMGDVGTGNRFPSPAFEAKVTTVYDGFASLARRMTQLVVDVYGLPNGWVEEEFAAPTLTAFKVLHYPPPPEEDCHGLRMAPHVDIDALTVLYQDPGVPGGLQVNVGGEWQDVSAPPGTLVVNVGELLKFLSGGIVMCTEHRVVMPSLAERANSERVSMALFLSPRDTTLIRRYSAQHVHSSTDEVCTAGQWFQNYLSQFGANE